MPGVPSTPREALVAFRRGLYATCTSWPDALFELCDAALCATGPVSSVPTLSLEPEFTRSHGSLYKALANGTIEEERFRRLLVGRQDRRRHEEPCGARVSVVGEQHRSHHSPVA